jgi:hypothetical protein
MALQVPDPVKNIAQSKRDFSPQMLKNEYNWAVFHGHSRMPFLSQEIIFL